LLRLVPERLPLLGTINAVEPNPLRLTIAQNIDGTPSTTPTTLPVKDEASNDMGSATCKRSVNAANNGTSVRSMG